MLNLRLEEIIVGLFLALLHLGFYHQLAHTPSSEKIKPPPILLEMLQPPPKPKPEPKPVHEAVVTKAGYGGSCKSALNRYPAEAREQEIEGTVKIKVQILADGSIGHASIRLRFGSASCHGGCSSVGLRQ